MENSEKKTRPVEGRVYIHGKQYYICIPKKITGTKRWREPVAMVHSDKEMNKKMKKLADATLAKRIAEFSENKKLDIHRECLITFNQLADKYLEWAKDHHSTDSCKWHINPLKKRFGDELISEISREDVSRYSSWRLAQGVKGSTVNHELRTMSSMYRLAAEEWDHPENKRLPYYEGRNPAKGFNEEDEESRGRYLTPGELVKVVDHIYVRLGVTKDLNPDKSKRFEEVTNERDRKGYKRLLDFLMLAVSTGMRKGEIQSLVFGSKDIRFSDDEPMENYIFLPGKKTKNGQAKKVFLNAVSRSILQKPFNFNYEPRHLWDRVRVDTGLEDVTIHDFRRTFGTYLNSEVKPGAFTLAAMLGHKVTGFDVTSIYARPDMEKMKEAMDKLGDYLIRLVYSSDKVQETEIKDTIRTQSGFCKVEEKALSHCR